MCLRLNSFAYFDTMKKETGGGADKKSVNTRDYPKPEVQRCIIHQIRNSTKFVSYKDIKDLMADLKRVYAAPTEETALNELELFKDKRDGKYPKVYKSWHDKPGSFVYLFQVSGSCQTAYLYNKCH